MIGFWVQTKTWIDTWIPNTTVNQFNIYTLSRGYSYVFLMPTLKHALHKINKDLPKYIVPGYTEKHIGIIATMVAWNSNPSTFLLPTDADQLEQIIYSAN